MKLEYRSSEISPDLCTDILVTLAVHLGYHIGSMKIWTTKLNVGFGEDLGWSVDKFTAHTDHGTIWLDNNNDYDLLADTLSLSTTNGVVTGRFGLASNSHMRSESGAIGRFVMPHPRVEEFDPKSISMDSVSGDMSLHFAFWNFPEQD